MSKILGGSQGEGKVVCGGEALGGELGWDMRTWGCAPLPPYPGCPDVRGQPAQICLPHSSRCTHRHCPDSAYASLIQMCAPTLPRSACCLYPDNTHALSAQMCTSALPSHVCPAPPAVPAPPDVRCGAGLPAEPRSKPQAGPAASPRFSKASLLIPAPGRAAPLRRGPCCYSWLGHGCWGAAEPPPRCCGFPARPEMLRVLARPGDGRVKGEISF